MTEATLIDSGPQLYLGSVLVRVKKPRLRDYKRFIELVAEFRFKVDLRILFSGDDQAAKEAFIALAETPDKVAEICALASDATVEQALDADLEQTLELVIACVKHANVVQAITGALKKVWGVTGTPPQET